MLDSDSNPEINFNHIPDTTELQASGLNAFEHIYKDTLTHFEENVQALVAAESTFSEENAELLGMFDVTLPSGDKFSGLSSDLPFFIRVNANPKSEKQARKINNVFADINSILVNPELYKEHLQMVICDAVTHGDIEATKVKSQKVTDLFEQFYKQSFNVHPASLFTMPISHTIHDFIEQNADLLTDFRDNFLTLRHGLETALLSYGSAMPEAVEKYLADNPDTANVHRQLLGYFFLIGATDTAAYFDKQLADSEEIRHKSTRLLLEGEGNLPKDIKNVASFILQLEAEGIVEQSDPRVLELFTQDPQVSKKVSKLTHIEIEKRKDVLLQWFKSFAQYLPKTLLMNLELEEMTRFMQTQVARSAQGQRLLKNSNSVSARRAQQLASKRAGQESEEQTSPEEKKEPRYLRTLSILPGGGWAIGGEYADASDFFENNLAKLFKGSPSELVVDVKNLLGELLDKGAELPAKKIGTFIKQPGTGKRFSIRQVKAAELSGTPVTTTETYAWRILYVLLDDGYPAILKIHHKDDQYETLKRFAK